MDATDGKENMPFRVHCPLTHWLGLPKVDPSGDFHQMQHCGRSPPAFGSRTLRSFICFPRTDALPPQLAHQEVVHLAFPCATGAKSRLTGPWIRLHTNSKGQRAFDLSWVKINQQATRFSDPFRVAKNEGALVDPGRAARPWAMISDPYQGRRRGRQTPQLALAPGAWLASGGKLCQESVAWRKFAPLLLGAATRHDKHGGYGSEAAGPYGLCFALLRSRLAEKK
jgi:hypothetical protein